MKRISFFPLAFMINFTCLGIGHASSLYTALTSGTTKIVLRPREEIANQSGLKASNALTLRTLLSYHTGYYHGLSSYIQFINVSSLVNQYNSLINGKVSYTSIPDPAETGVNQAYLQYQLPRIKVIAGRQEIVLGNSRFVGNADFFQTPQSFDAVSIKAHVFGNIGFFASYIWSIKNILNNVVPSDTYLLRGTYKPSRIFSATAFSYWYANISHTPIAGSAQCFLPGSESCNSVTTGGKLQGAISLSRNFHLGYSVSYALQKPFHGGSRYINSNYFHTQLSGKYMKTSISLDYMDMGSHHGEYGFQTPLATKHLFNGWADVFLTTPKNGLISKYITINQNIQKLNLLARYYNFNYSFGNQDVGHEVDLSAIYHYRKNAIFGIQYADFLTSNKSFKNTQAGWIFLKYMFSSSAL